MMVCLQPMHSQKKSEDTYMERKQKIHIQIDGIDLPMLVSSTDEEKRYRDAAKYINECLLSVKQKYPNVPSEKYYTSIVMLDLARKGVEISNAHSIEPYKKAISELSSEISSALSD